MRVHAAPDPAWTADGYVSDRWLPASPVTGRLDAFEWRVPLSGMLGAPVIEPEAPVETPIEIASGPPPRDPDGVPVAAAASEPVLHPIEPPPAKFESRPEVRAEPIIPLVHAPGRSRPRHRRGNRGSRRPGQRLAEDFGLTRAALSSGGFLRIIRYEL